METERIKLEIEKLELRKKELELKISDLRNATKVEELKKHDPSAAELYLRRQEQNGYLNSLPSSCTSAYANRDIIAGYIIAAHEAGQRYATHVGLKPSFGTRLSCRPSWLKGDPGNETITYKQFGKTCKITFTPGAAVEIDSDMTVTINGDIKINGELS